MLQVSEKQWQGTVINYARSQGWLVGFTYDARKSEPGEPDLRMVRPPRYVEAELKTEKGKLTKGRWNKAGTRWLSGQDEWGDALSACPGLEYYLWRPSDWDEVEKVLGASGEP